MSPQVNMDISFWLNLKSAFRRRGKFESTCGNIRHSLLDRRRHAGGLDGDAAVGQGDVERVAEPKAHFSYSAPSQHSTFHLAEKH